MTLDDGKIAFQIAAGVLWQPAHQEMSWFVLDSLQASGALWRSAIFSTDPKDKVSRNARSHGGVEAGCS